MRHLKPTLLAGAGLLSVIMAAGLAPRLERLASPAADLPERVDFNLHIRPILNQRCVSCHGGVKQAGQLSFLYRDKAMSAGKSGLVAVKPGDPSGSHLVQRITDRDDPMPPPEHGPMLAAQEVSLIKKWIQQGAPWGEHWAYVKPLAHEPPAVANSAWPRNDIDHFVLDRLQRESLKPAPEAPKAQWLRRAALDLTGVPPTPEEVDAFVADSSPEAFATQADRLLASPRFGERWAAAWLDLARYADSTGFEKDMHRDVWAWRDWVVRALNNDMPFDQFTVKQIAGDLLPDPSLDDLVATAFHRHTQMNTEGGTRDEEYRVAAVLDRVNATWQAWMGTTFNCVQCHDHPYDPLPNKDYYRFAAFFNNTADCDWQDYPKLAVPADPADGPKVVALEKEKQDVSEAVMAPFRPLAAATAWRPLDYRSAESTGPTKLVITGSGDGREIQVADTAAKGAVFTVRSSVPLPNVSAIRIDALLPDGHSALNPAPSFVASKIEVAQVAADGTSTPVPLAFLASDLANDFMWPPDSLLDNAEGWGAFPDQFHPTWAVLVPVQPVALAPGEFLQVVVRHNYGKDGGDQPVLRRFRLSATDDPAWTSQGNGPEAKARLARRAAVAAELGKLQATTVPVMRERPAASARPQAVFHRGNWMDKGEIVTPGVPGLIPGLTTASNPTRLDLARWLVGPENPLTARVAVNRFWEQLFGTGLVETLEDFGSAGQHPSHPELLDWLAVRFVRDHAWSVKKVLREMVLSATYRQDQKVSPELLARDPRNRLLARGPRTRLTAEMVRDQALAVSGLLSPKMGGPPVMPPQPEGIWNIPYSSLQWKTSGGEDRHRRALYTYWRRTRPYPSFQTFDAPGREVCTARRMPTNTPLQALVTLNDPVYLECARALAARMKAEGGPGPEGWMARGLRLVTGREAAAADVATLGGLYEDILAQARAAPEESRPLAPTPEEAALIIAASTVLNLDAAVTK